MPGRKRQGYNNAPSPINRNLISISKRYEKSESWRVPVAGVYSLRLFYIAGAFLVFNDLEGWPFQFYGIFHCRSIRVAGLLPAYFHQPYLWYIVPRGVCLLPDGGYQHIRSYGKGRPVRWPGQILNSLIFVKHRYVRHTYIQLYQAEL